MIRLVLKDGSRLEWSLKDPPPLEKLGALDVRALIADGEELRYIKQHFDPSFIGMVEDVKQVVWVGERAVFIAGNMAAQEEK